MPDKNLIDNRTERVMLSKDEHDNAGPIPTHYKEPKNTEKEEEIRAIHDINIQKNPIVITDADTIDELIERAGLAKSIDEIQKALNRGENADIKLHDGKVLSIERSLNDNVFIYKINNRVMEPEELNKTLKSEDAPYVKKAPILREKEKEKDKIFRKKKQLEEAAYYEGKENYHANEEYRVTTDGIEENDGEISEHSHQRQTARQKKDEALSI